MARQYILSDLITDLQAILTEHGDMEVVNSNHSPFTGNHVEVVKGDDWNNTTKTEDGEIPGVAFMLALGRN